jgi:RNA polymerase sigma-70 factor, ECF subfamily
MEEVPMRLVKAAAGGDINAFEEIYRLTQGLVYSVSLRVTQNHAAADDVAQEVFIKLYNSLKSFQFASSFKTWVYRITVNTAINYYHKSGREQKIKSDRDLVMEHREREESPLRAGEQEDNKRLVDRLLAKLNPDQRACVVLREIEGLDYKEIAGALKVNINTVRSRLKRARETLSAYAKKEAYNELPQSAGNYNFRV